MRFAAEDQLLIQCCRVEMRDATITAVGDLLQQNLDWDYILESSIRHGVSPMLYYGLNQLSQLVAVDEIVPRRTMEELRRLYQSNQSRNRRLYRVIGEIFKAFERTGIQAMGLKDVQLAWGVYPDIGLRPMGDIDILIHPEDYRKVAACMAELGFDSLPSSDIPFTLKYAEGHHFLRRNDNVWVDMQWNACGMEWDIYHEGNFEFGIDKMWRGARTMLLDDYQMLVPKPEDMLFHLCLHLEGHQYCELILFCDIVELLRYYDGQLDWEYLGEITKQYKAESSVYYVLYLIQRLFHISLPQFLLGELEPIYFKANIFKPLFGNLTTLHLSLDQMRSAVRPPPELINKFETIVRRQAIGAMQLYREIDTIASSFVGLGGQFIILSGTSSERLYPEPSLKPFGEIYFFILDTDLPRMRESLSSCGFRPGEVSHSEIYAKRWNATSVDPALCNQASVMVVEACVERDIDFLLRLEDLDNTAKKNVALRSLQAKLVGHEHDDTSIPARIKIIALSAEELLLYLSARLGRQERDRLFGLCSLIEFFRGFSGRLNWGRIESIAQRYGVTKAVYEGLLLVDGVLEDSRIPPDALGQLIGADLRPRVLEWARFNPAVDSRYTGFKRAFFYLFSFLSMKGLPAKCRYLLRSLAGGQGSGPVLPGLALELMISAFSLLRRKRRTIREFAYWIEP